MSSAAELLITLSMFFRIAAIVLPVYLIVALGYFYGRRKQPEMAIVNQINMDVFLPALVLSVLSQKGFAPEHYGMLALGAAFVVLGSGILSLPVARWAGIEWKTLIPPMMFTNYGNLGLPLFVFTFGQGALSAAVILFVVGNSLHFTLGRYLLDRTIHPLSVFRTPMMVAAILGLGFSITDTSLPVVLATPVEMLGQVSIPLLLFSLGVRLTDIKWEDWRHGLLGAALCPLSGIALAFLFQFLFDLDQTQSKQIILFGALPPAILNYLFAEQFGQEPGKVASIVMTGNLVSILVIPLVLALLL